MLQSKSRPSLTPLLTAVSRPVVLPCKSCKPKFLTRGLQHCGKAPVAREKKAALGKARPAIQD
jgi:hypothetical protein